MFDHCSVSRIKIILWGSREEEFNEVAKLLVKRISTKLIYSEIYLTSRLSLCFLIILLTKLVISF